MQPDTPARWAAYLRACAGEPPEKTPDVLGAIAGAFDAIRRQERVTAPAPVDDDPLAAVWWARVDARVPLEVHLAVDAEGPLLTQGLYQAIEVWTDSELSALHALGWIAQTPMGTRWRERLRRAVVWHLEYTQPDNATNRPWAVHVFVEHDAPESNHYAATLVHNCLATTGRPDPLSTMILLDAAEALDPKEP